MKPLILVVDDDPAIQIALTMLLQSAGYAVSLASNGYQAMERIAKQRPALVLLDLNMPVMSGWDVARLLRARGCTIPLIVMTAGHSAVVEAKRCSADGYLPKPFELDTVLNTVARFARTEQDS